jgi:molybdopterin converting factor small subunit
LSFSEKWKKSSIELIACAAADELNMQDEKQSIEITFYGPLRLLLDKERVEVDARDRRSIKEVLLALGVPADQLLYTMALVNNKRVDLDTPLSPGDRIDVFQPVGGG